MLESASYSTDTVSNPEKFQDIKEAIKPHNSSNEVSVTASKKMKETVVIDEVKDKETISLKIEEEPAKKRMKIDASASIGRNGSELVE